MRGSDLILLLSSDRFVLRYLLTSLVSDYYRYLENSNRDIVRMIKYRRYILDITIELYPYVPLDICLESVYAIEEAS